MCAENGQKDGDILENRGPLHSAFPSKAGKKIPWFATAASQPYLYIGVLDQAKILEMFGAEGSTCGTLVLLSQAPPHFLRTTSHGLGSVMTIFTSLGHRDSHHFAYCAEVLRHLLSVHVFGDACHDLHFHAQQYNP